MDLDMEKATAILLETDIIPSTYVVTQLKQHDQYLLRVRNFKYTIIL